MGQSLSIPVEQELTVIKNGAQAKEHSRQSPNICDSLISVEAGWVSPGATTAGAASIQIKHGARQIKQMSCPVLGKSPGPRIESQNPRLIQPSVETQAVESEAGSIARPKAGSRHDKIRKAFSLIDGYGDGVISCEQLVGFLCETSGLADSHADQKLQTYKDYLLPLFTDSQHKEKCWSFKEFEHFMLARFEQKS